MIVRLPIQAEQPTELATIQAANPSPLNVLLVEDDPNIRDIEAEYLRGDGHTVTTATNGQEGWQTFRTGRFDLVVANGPCPR